MADQNVKVNLEENSKYRVAYQLMWDIANDENKPRTREYMLRLYRQCYNTVNGYNDMKSVLAETQAETNYVVGAPNRY